LAFATLIALPAAASAQVVTTADGAVRGVVRHGALEFRGMPYAAAPVGRLRFAAPQPATPWQGVFDATRFGMPCAQAARYQLTAASHNEDCLRVNVSLPADLPPGERLPVLVWVHGGAFVGGGAELYRLDRLATRGRLVVVSFNYRLGVFGWMPQPALPRADNGGWALEDQRAALRWVQRNIAAFGGDPRRVTLAGESAGAFAVCAHLLSPERVAGLFERAILSSAACLQPLPTLDEALASGQVMRVPLLAGGTRNELRLYVAYDLLQKPPPPGFDATSLRRYWLPRYYGADRDAAIGAEYAPHGVIDGAEFGSMLSDYNPTIGLNNCLYLASDDALVRWLPELYAFEYADADAPVLGVGIGPGLDPGIALGAVHASDLSALFPHFSNTAANDGPDLAPASQRLSDAMLAAWAAFAHGKGPAATGLPAWPRYRSAADVMLLRPDRSQVYDASVKHRCAFWQRLYPDALRQGERNPTPGGAERPM
jgi:para-nitrobenzyl esterase